jgi:plasmid stabilization system protein ParE
MSYQVSILTRAREDLDGIIAWVTEKSPKGAARLLARFTDAVAKLRENPFIAPIAPESRDVGEEVRHIMFRTRAGRTYRALFVIIGQEVRILRVRGAGQPPLEPDDIQI